MKTVVYLDVLLLVNFVIDYLLLQAVGLLCGERPNFRRSVAGAGVAALSTLVLLMPPLPPLLQAGWAAGSAAAIVLVTFGPQSRVALARRGFWFLALNLLLAGMLTLPIAAGQLPGSHANNLAVYLNLSPGLLFGGALGVYLALRAGTLLLGRPQRAPMFRLTLIFPGGEAAVRALPDTGFSAREPLSGLPVVLVSLPAVKNQLPTELADWLESWFSAPGGAEPPPGVKLRLVPLHTAAGDALAPAFPVQVRREAWTGLAAAAFTPQPFSGGEFTALVSPEFAETS